MSVNDECCPKFNPDPWADQEINWENKLFVRDRVKSIFHIPLNFGTVMTRNMSKIEATGAKADEQLLLSDENSLWGADVYIHVTKNVEDVNMVTLSGTFLSKVFEGPYKDISSWVKEMKEYVTSSSKEMKKLYFYYTTCPKCAKKYGRNYVVLLAQI